MTGSSVVMLLADLSPQALTELRAAVRTDAGKRTAFRDCGGVELLLSRLGSSSSVGGAGGAKARAELLFTLAFCCDDEARTYVRDAGGLGTAAALLRETLDAPDAFECCTYAVGLLASHSHSSRVALVEAGALATLAAALPAAAPPRPRLARAACCRTVVNVANVVRTLCEECRPAKEAAVAEGVVAGLCAAAVQEPQVAPCALSALAAAVYKCPPAQAAFLGSAAFAVLPELLLSTTPPSLEASRCLYAAGPAAATAVGEAVAAAGARRTPDLHQSLAAAAAEFAAREARSVAAAAAAATAATDGAAAAASAPTRVVPYVGGAALSVAGVAAVLRPGDTMLSVELELGDVELAVHAVEVQRGGAAVTLSLRNEAGAEVCGAKDGASSLLWRCCQEGEEAGAATQAAVYSVMVEGGCGGGDVAVAVYANGHDGEAGGLRGLVARVPAPPAEAAAAAAAAAPVRSSETEELSRQVADLAKKVSQFEVAAPQPPPPQATESPPQPQPDSQAALLAEDNRALKRRIGDMERESMDARRELVASRHMVERLSRQQQPPPSLRRDSFASSASGMSSASASASASSLGALNEEVESVTRQLEHLDAECEANNNELGRFLTQLTQLRERMGGGGASRASCDTLG